MVEQDEILRLSQLARILHISTENLRALADLDRFPPEIAPQREPVSGMRYWYRSQLPGILAWDRVRLKRPKKPALVIHEWD